MSRGDVPVQDGVSDEDFAKLKHAVELTREAMAIVMERNDDLTGFFLKNALQSLHYVIQQEAEGYPDREAVTLTVHEAERARTVKVRRRRPSPPQHFSDHDEDGAA